MYANAIMESVPYQLKEVVNIIRHGPVHNPGTREVCDIGSSGSGHCEICVWDLLSFLRVEMLGKVKFDGMGWECRNERNSLSQGKGTAPPFIQLSRMEMHTKTLPPPGHPKRGPRPCFRSTVMPMSSQGASDAHLA